MRGKLPLLAALAVVTATLAVFVPSAFSAVWTDQADYSPGSVVTIHGDNSNGAGYQPGEPVDVNVNGPNGYTSSCQGTADSFGAWSCQVTLNADSSAGGSYTYTATGMISGTQETGSFTDTPKADPPNAPLCNTPSASPDCAGATSLPTLNDTHYKVHVGDTITGIILNATDAVTNVAPCLGSDQVLVIIQSTPLGNTNLCGTLSGSTITFQFKAPSNGCSTSTVSYNAEGHHATNDIIADVNSGIPVVFGDQSSTAGYAFVDSNGNVIPPNADGTCGTTTIPKADALIPSKDANGSYDNTFKWTIKKEADQTKVFTAGGATSDPVNYTVTVTHDSGTVSNVQVTGTINVNNPNSANVQIDSVTDQLSDGTVCSVTGGGSQSLAPGDTKFPYSCSLGSVPLSIKNKVTVNWAAQTLSDGSQLDAGPASFTTPTDINFVENDVNNCVTVNDTNPKGPQNVQLCSTDASPKLFQYSDTFADPAGTCTDHKNTATFTATDDSSVTDSASTTVTDCQGADLTASKTVTPSFKKTYKWSLNKSVDSPTVYSAGGGTSGAATYTVTATHDSGQESGWQVNGTITVNNPNDWESVDANVSDAIPGGTCLVEGKASDTVTVPAADNSGPGSVTVSYSCTGFSSNPGKGTNTASVTWDKTKASTPDGEVDPSKGFDFGSVNPTLVDKCLTVSDPLDSSSPRAFCVGDAGEVDNHDGTFSFTYQYSATFTGDPAGTCTPHDNQAKGSTSDSNTEVDSNSVTVSDCQGADLKVSKTASPSYTRTFGWKITKNVDKSSVTIDPWQSATFNYTVNVTHDTGTDSAFAVSGTITVSNPNDWESVTLTGVTDAIDNGGSCSITSGNVNAVLAKKGSVGDSTQLGYKCTFGSNPASGTNKATASWDSSAAHTVDGSASGTAGYTFGDPTTLKDRCFTATDTFNGGSPLTLGVACIDPTSWTKDAGNNLANFQESFTDPTFTFTYSRTIHAPSAGTCAPAYKNTAKFKTNDTGATGSADASVTVCSYQAPLTIGYWGNHLALSGTSGCSGLPNGTGCSSNGPFTKTYLPQKLGNYQVDTFQKAAAVIAANNCSNASSSSQNAIACLAAQLLAAELNAAYGANPCIVTVADGINDANKFLSGGTVDGVTGITYTGPTSTYTLTTAQRNEALVLKNKLVNYNQGGGC